MLSPAMRRTFIDRDDAGWQLGVALRPAFHGRELLVLGLPRGGVPVAAAVADALEAQFDVLVVRKVGAPGHAELAMGAVAAGGIEARVPAVLELLPDAARQFAAVAARERDEVARREHAYRGSQAPLQLEGRVVVLVDDGIATGATMEAAILACRQGRAARIVVAVPVAAPQAIARLARLADEVICLQQPPDFAAVGEWYQRFEQLDDDDVRRCLAAPRTTP